MADGVHPQNPECFQLIHGLKINFWLNNILRIIISAGKESQLDGRNTRIGRALINIQDLFIIPFIFCWQMDDVNTTFMY